MTHNDLVMIGKKWLQRNGCSVAVTEISNAFSREVPDVLGFRYGETTLIEVKVSRSDFLADKKKVFRQFPNQGMGNYRYYLVPKGLVSQDEIPGDWTLLECSEKGRVTCCVEGLPPHKRMGDWRYINANREAERGLMYSMLRRLNTKLGDVDEVFHAYDKEIEFK